MNAARRLLSHTFWRPGALPRAARYFSCSARPQNRTPPGAYIPYVTEVSAGGWRTCEVDDAMSATAVAQLLWLEAADPERPITMYINSPGGSVSSGLAIYDTMNYIKPPVSTVCIGMAASMGALLLTGGEPGKRYSLPHSSIMIHQPLGGTKGQATDILIYANELQRIRKQINVLYERHLNKAAGFKRYDLDTINNMMERDKYLTPEEAKELGVIDDILVRRVPEDSEKPTPPENPESSASAPVAEGEPGEGEAKATF